MDISLTILGIIILVASLIGGNIEGGGISIPTLANPATRVVVGLLGVCLVLITQSVYIEGLLSTVVECSETEREKKGVKSFVVF